MNTIDILLCINIYECITKFLRKLKVVPMQGQNGDF